jgi:hypothetical protein
MTRIFGHQEHRSHGRLPVLLELLALLTGAALIAGCGSSSEPAYCDAATKTENAVKSLPTVDDVTANGVGTLKTALTTLQQNATTAMNQAKSDFSTQTTALKTSVDALSTTVKQVAGTPSVQTLALLPAQLSAVDTAAKNLQSAVSSKCG